jgi:hypothetical protein
MATVRLTDPEMRKVAVEKLNETGNVSSYYENIKIAHKGYQLTEDLVKSLKVNHDVQEKKQDQNQQFLNDLSAAAMIDRIKNLAMMLHEDELLQRAEEEAEAQKETKPLAADTNIMQSTKSQENKKVEDPEEKIKLTAEGIDAIISMLHDLHEKVVSKIKDDLKEWKDSSKTLLDGVTATAVKTVGDGYRDMLTKNPMYTKYESQFKAAARDPDLEKKFSLDPEYRAAREVVRVVEKLSHPETVKQTVGEPVPLAQAVAAGVTAFKAPFEHARKTMDSKQASQKMSELHEDRSALFAGIRSGLKPSEIRALRNAKLATPEGAAAKTAARSVNSETSEMAHDLLETKHQVDKFTNLLTEAKEKLQDPAALREVKDKIMQSVKETQSFAEKLMNKLNEAPAQKQEHGHDHMRSPRPPG